MNDFIELKGASGAAYRFRRWVEGTSHLPIAGNYVYVREAGEGFKVVLVGVTTDLSRSREDVVKAVPRKGGHLYTRLNVSRTTRQGEHDDLVAANNAALVSDVEG